MSGARSYSWPPFEAGNTIGVRSGAFSPRVIDASVESERRAFLEDNPHLAEPAFRFAVDRLLRLEVRARLLHEYAVRVATEKGIDAVPARVLAEASNADSAATRLGGQLGIDPASRMRIARDATDAGRTAESMALSVRELTAKLRQRFAPTAITASAMNNTSESAAPAVDAPGGDEVPS